MKLAEKCASPHGLLRAAITRRCFLVALLSALAISFGLLQSALAQPDPLPSWNDGKVKQSIIDFVTRVTKKEGPDYVPPEDRIATFDNDGCLWAEKPTYFQLLFAIDRVKGVGTPTS
jgi:hypothetical protein